MSGIGKLSNLLSEHTFPMKSFIRLWEGQSFYCNSADFKFPFKCRNVPGKTPLVPSNITDHLLYHFWTCLRFFSYENVPLKTMSFFSLHVIGLQISTNPVHAL